jgi:hypothetical protein
VNINLDPAEPWTKRLNEVGVDYKDTDSWLRIRFTPKEFVENTELLREMLHEAVAEDEKD